LTLGDERRWAGTQSRCREYLPDGLGSERQPDPGLTDAHGLRRRQARAVVGVASLVPPPNGGRGGIRLGRADLDVRPLVPRRGNGPGRRLTGPTEFFRERWRT